MRKRKNKPAVFMLVMFVTETQAVCLDISVSPEKCLVFLSVCPDSVVLDALTMKPVLLEEIAEKALLELVR